MRVRRLREGNLLLSLEMAQQISSRSPQFSKRHFLPASRWRHGPHLGHGAGSAGTGPILEDPSARSVETAHSVQAARLLKKAPAHDRSATHL